jgi:hydrogenase maturation factor
MKRRRRARSSTPSKQPDAVLPLGKLPARLLERLLGEVVFLDPTVLQGPGIGLDAALIAPPQSEMLAITSDPITFTSGEIGAHLIAVNVNDLATTGACPRWLMLDLLFPPGTTEKQVEAQFHSIGEACKEHELTIIGGHTEISDAVTRPVAVGVLLGTVKRDRKVDPSRARPGDRILLIGPIAIEGTAVLARERAEEIDEALGRALRIRAESLVVEPGICIRDAALLAVSRYLAHALHDPTEGGLATALRELAAVTRCGVEIDSDAVAILPETTAICRHFGIDPFGLLASGALLAVLPENEALRLAGAAREILGVRAAVIGALTESPECLWKDPRGYKAPIPDFARDELARVLERPRVARQGEKK